MGNSLNLTCMLGSIVDYSQTLDCFKSWTCFENTTETTSNLSGF